MEVTAEEDQCVIRRSETTGLYGADEDLVVPAVIGVDEDTVEPGKCSVQDGRSGARPGRPLDRAELIGTPRSGVIGEVPGHALLARGEHRDAEAAGGEHGLVDGGTAVHAHQDERRVEGYRRERVRGDAATGPPAA